MTDTKKVTVDGLEYIITRERHGDVWIEPVDDSAACVGGSLWYEIMGHEYVATIDELYTQHGHVMWDLYVWDNARDVIKELEGMFY